VRETIRSLSIYFVVSGLIGAGLNGVELARATLGSLAMANGLLGLVIAGVCFYFGARLRPLLASAPRRVLDALKATAVYLAILFVIAIVRTPSACVPIAAGFLVTGYLFVNARRLAAELAEPSQTGP
jgi:hypothetical protein